MPRDGRSEPTGGFHQAVLYLAADTLGSHPVGVAVDQSALTMTRSGPGG